MFDLYKKLWPYYKKYFLRLVFVFFNVFLFALSNVYFLALVRELSYDIERQNIGLFVYRICGGVVLALVRSLASFGQTYHMSWIAQRVVMKLRNSIYEHLQKLSHDFYAKWKIGEIMSRSLNDLNVVQGVFVSNIVELIPEMVTFVGVLAYLLVLNWQLLIMTFITLPLFAWLIQSFGKSMKKISKYNQRKQADISAILQETIYGIGIIKAFASERKEIDKYRKETELSFWINMKSSRLYALQSPVLFMIQVVMILLIFMVGGLQIINGHLTVGNFVAFITGIALLVNPINILGRVHAKQQQAMVSLDRIYELLDLAPTVQEKKDALNIESINGDVEFNNVTFTYEAKNGPVLKNINLDVNTGEVIALVGSSGAGKTTFVNLIPRFYDVSEGSIKIDGHDIRDLSFESLRSKIGIVTQETILFSGTIKDNIAYGRDHSSQADIERAAEMANASGFIELFASRYNTLVGERGVKLSGGQRQRVAIARAILSDPRILILDEATSALDSESEKLVQKALDNLMQGRTSFIIAHRLSTILHADRIVVLDQGEIKGIGKHEELLANNPIYKKLYTIQFLAKEKKQALENS